MNAKKVLLISLFCLLICFSCTATRAVLSISNGESASSLCISNSRSYGLCKDIIFKAGVFTSAENSLFASVSAHLYRQQICEKAFRSPGDSAILSFGFGFSRRLSTDNLLLNAGLDFLFSSSCITRLNSLLFCELGYEKLLLKLDGTDVFLLLRGKFSYAKELDFESSGIGLCLKTGGLR